MIDTPSDSSTGSDSSSGQTQGGTPAPDAEARAARRKGLPWWLWALMIAFLVGVLALIAIPLLNSQNSLVATSESPTPQSSASPTQPPTNTATPTPTPTAPDSGQGAFDSEMFAFMADVLNSQNTSVLAQGGTFTDPVHVVVANSGQDSNLSPDDAVAAMSFMFTPLDPNPWDLALSDSVLASFRAGPYGAYFPEGAIVAKSQDGHLFSFIGHGSKITTMFMSADVAQLLG